MKKVIFLLIDSFIPQVFESCLKKGKVPVLKFLKEHGRYWSYCVTAFPTMTASVDASLMTGTYPDVHKVPGLIWYDPEEDEIINYINGGKTIWKTGLVSCARNALYRLNEKHLNKNLTTIFEELHDRGFSSASINLILHRGRNKHLLRLPFFLNLMTGFQLNGSISGPDILTLGAMSSIPEARKNIGKFKMRCWNNYGINDTYAVETAKTLILSGNQPDFMMVYLPDNDHSVHITNPDHAEQALLKVDQQIRKLFDSFDTWEKALEKNIFIVTGDHGQTRIGNDQQYNIDLEDILQEFHPLKLGKRVTDQVGLVICNNERMAYIYPVKDDLDSKIISRLKSEQHIDQIAYKQGNRIIVHSGGTEKMCLFEKEGPYTDVYGNRWFFQGDQSILDIQIEGNFIKYGEYPDVLSRLYGALFSQVCPIIVITAESRYEFKTKYYPTHLGGGSHGSLHHFDSIIPLIVSGTDHFLSEHPRIVDLKKFIISLFDQQQKQAVLS
ncbi:alkaline phosphatase family protein [Microaerobacter geothermalis]|uniref:alkaline phosphatase family protein n=1 Tax=Microaerobacter geothermalis TaxID=674972 RepID=UPI001F35479D|nr:alkaline phosphatase family protein [Microaerobacter geothermalis]MCF6093086.1 alkaline phosphatase family protein [Microaerobacter geothermalis]